MIDRDQWLLRPASERHLSYAEWLDRPTDAPRPAKNADNKPPKELSPGEEAFARCCQVYKLTPEREYIFAEGRKWAFDYAWPDRKLAVEIEGGTEFGKSRHSKGDGFERDARKYNAAALQGWAVLRFSTGMVMSGEAIDTVLGLMK